MNKEKKKRELGSVVALEARHATHRMGVDSRAGEWQQLEVRFSSTYQSDVKFVAIPRFLSLYEPRSLSLCA